MKSISSQLFRRLYGSDYTRRVVGLLAHLLVVLCLTLSPSPSLAASSASGDNLVKNELTGRGLVGAQSLATLFGGGPGGSIWIVGNTSGTDTGLPDGRVYPGTPGLAVEDATLGGIVGSAYDTGMTLWVNNSIFIAPASVTTTAQSLTAGPVFTQSLNITVEYYAAADSATLRTLASFQNPTASPVAISVYWASNVGSDTSPFISGTSSGDTIFTTGDHWVVTTDDPTDTSLTTPVNTHVLFGPCNPPVRPQSVTPTVFEYNGLTDGIGAAYTVTIPAGATRRLLFFNQMSPTNADAFAAATTFNANSSLGNDLLAGLAPDQFGEVVNWTFGCVFLPLVMRSAGN